MGAAANVVLGVGLLGESTMCGRYVASSWVGHLRCLFYWVVLGEPMLNVRYPLFR